MRSWEVLMDQPGSHDPTRACSFCQGMFPAIVHLFHAPEGPSICDRCVEMLAEDLRLMRGRNVPREVGGAASDTVALAPVEWGMVIDELRRLGYPWLADQLQDDLARRGTLPRDVTAPVELRAREARVVRRIAEAMAVVVEEAGAAAVAAAERVLRDRRGDL